MYKTHYYVLKTLHNKDRSFELSDANSIHTVQTFPFFCSQADGVESPAACWLLVRLQASFGTPSAETNFHFILGR